MALNGGQSYNNDFHCVFCHQYIENHSSRYLTNSKSNAGIETFRLLNEAPVKVSISHERNSYLCKTCRRLLQKRDGLKKNLQCTENDLIFRSDISSVPECSTPKRTIIKFPECNLSSVNATIKSGPIRDVYGVFTSAVSVAEDTKAECPKRLGVKV